MFSHVAKAVPNYGFVQIKMYLLLLFILLTLKIKVLLNKKYD